MARRRSHVLLDRVLVMPEDLSPWRTIGMRVGFALLILAVLILLLWLDREGLQDQSDGVVSFIDVIYFTMVTITTVGYGDIVPVTPQARLFDALVLTPVRIFMWLFFIGTAYQLAIKQFAEGYRMAKLKASLDQHIIVCGVGHTGYAAIKELLAKGTDPEQILAIDSRDDRVRSAVELGAAAIRGDASTEGTLNDAIIEKAQAIIIATGRDDTNTLILLTVKNLAPKLRVLVSAKEEENVKLMKQAGANTIITPATFGGSMLAAAVTSSHLAHYFQDLLTAGGKVDLIEEAIKQEEIGKSAKDFLPNVLLRVYRGGNIISLTDLQGGECLQQNDVILLLKQTPAES